MEHSPFSLRCLCDDNASVRVAIIHNIPEKIREKTIGAIENILTSRKINVSLVDVSDLSLVFRGGGFQSLVSDKLLDVDTVFWRVISGRHFHGCCVGLEQQGVLVINSSESLNNSKDKITTASLLASAGLPVAPFMVLPPGGQWAEKVWRSFGPDVVIKPSQGMKGRGVTRVTSLDDIQEKVLSQSDSEVLIGQPYLNHDEGGDVRVFVADGRVVASACRVPAKDEWRGNLDFGASFSPIQLTPLQQEVAVESTKTLGLTFAGVDFIQTASGPKILEVNPNPGIAIGEACGVNIPEVIADVVVHRTLLH